MSVKLTMNGFCALSARLAGLLFSLLPLALPLYGFRLKLGLLPTTILELYVLVLMGLFTVGFGIKAWFVTWCSLGKLGLIPAAWFIISLIEVFVAPDVRAGFGLWRAYVLEPMLVGTIALYFFRVEPEQRMYIQKSSFYLVCLLAVFSAIQFLGQGGIPAPWNVAIAAGRRAVGPFTYPNALALLVTPIGAWAFVQFIQSLLALHLTTTRSVWRDFLSFCRDFVKNRQPWKFFGFMFGAHADWLALFTCLAAIVCVLLAKSDGAIVALVVTCFASLVWERRTRDVAILLASIAALILMLIPEVRTGLYELLSFQGWSGRVRIWMWQETWQMIRAYPIGGAGFGGYPTVFKSFHLKTFIEIFQYPHQILLNFWSETGFFGLLSFLALLGAWVRIAWKHEKRLLAPLLAIVIHGLVDVPYFKNDLAMWFWLAWALVVVSIPAGSWLDRLFEGRYHAGRS